MKRWVAFLRNHKEDIAAMDLFTVPTASLRLLYGFFVIEHGRRHIVHFNATFHPTAAWMIHVGYFTSRDSFSRRPRGLPSPAPEPAVRLIRCRLAVVKLCFLVAFRLARPTVPGGLIMMNHRTLFVEHPHYDR